MNLAKSVCALFLAVSSGFCPTGSLQAQGEKPVADLVLKDGAIYTMDASRTWAESVAVRDGKIIFVGLDEDAKEFIGPKTRIVDLKGRMVMPSFQDCHVHPLMGSIERGGLDLGAFKTSKEVLDAVRKFAADSKGAEWIVCGGWKLPLFADAGPRKEDLDAVVPDKPAYIESEDGHSSWVNSRALKIAGIKKGTPDPAHGRIERDPKTGEPSGTLRESACELVEKHVPKLSAEKREEALRRIQSTFNQMGITSVQDAWLSGDLLESYEQLDRKGGLTLKVAVCLYVDPEKDETQIAELIKLRDTANTPHVRANSVKMFADGVIEAHTAALLDPYIGAGSEQGILNYEPANFSRLATAIDRAGFQIHIHAIGDRAVRTALDALEAAMKANGKRDSRHEIAHLQLIQPGDRPRFRELSVIANFQPYWSQGDDYMYKMTEPVLGPERSKLQYPIASIFKTGAVVVGGSDWPVTTANPLEEIEVAVTHRDLGVTDAPVWNADERIDLPRALAAYTINAAYANRRERETGSIEPGKDADLIVLDKNLFSLPAEKIHTAKVMLTLFEGREVFRDGSL